MPESSGSYTSTCLPRLQLLVFPAFIASPEPCPQMSFPCKSLKGVVVKAGYPTSFSPFTPCKKHKKRETRKHNLTFRSRDGKEHSPYQFPVGGPASPLLPFRLCPPSHLLPFLLAIHLPSSHTSSSSRIVTTLPNLRFPKEGQNRFRCPPATEEHGHPERPLMFLPTELAHVLPQLSDLGLPGLAVHEEVVMGGSWPHH